MSSSRKFTVPRNRIGRDLSALDEGPDHIGLRREWIDNEPRIVRIERSNESPVAGPRIHFDFDETGANPFARCRPVTATDASPDLSNAPLVRLDQGRKRRAFC